MAELTLRDIRKNYGVHEVIKGVDLEIQKGEFVVFVGPSGCGKSTLLRMIAGLESITGGELEIGGQRCNDVHPGDRGIAMVFQSYALYPHMSVRDNIGFNLKVAGIRRQERAERVEAAAKILQIEHLLERKPVQLSGGQRQRVAIGRAIVREPQVFLFDEPLSNLDAALRVDMRMELSLLHERLGATMVYVTHDQVEAMTLADKIVVIDQGEVQQSGAPIELYRRPRNLFVAGFIGSPKMNFIPVKVTGVEDGVAIVEAQDLSPVAVPANLSGVTIGDTLTLGVRPQDLSPGEAGLTVSVELVERLGHETIASGKNLSGIPIMAVLDGDMEIPQGARITMGFDVEKAILFAPSGDSLLSQ